jgi:neutral amino acid transport system permease protein
MDLQLVINGIALGCIIALAAIGLSMVYRILNFANFAQGDFLTLGAYLALAATGPMGPNFPLVTIISMIAVAAISILLDVIIWKPMRSKKASRTSLMILSIGLALIARNSIIIAFGSDFRKYPLPVKEGLSLSGLVVTEYQLAVMVVAVVVMLSVHQLLRKTSLGKAMRALSDNPDLARISGIDVDKVIRYTWAVGMGLAALSGVMYGLVTNINPNMGWFLILPIFAAAILGGIGNPYGAMIGGMIIGLSQEISTAVIPSQYKIAVSFAIMIVVLFIRPQGIMGDR